MEIDVKKESDLGHPSGTKMSQFNVIVTFEGDFVEVITITVVLPKRDGEDATQAQAIAAAKELALQFYGSTSA